MVPLINALLDLALVVVVGGSASLRPVSGATDLCSTGAYGNSGLRRWPPTTPWSSWLGVRFDDGLKGGAVCRAPPLPATTTHRAHDRAVVGSRLVTWLVLVLVRVRCCVCATGRGAAGVAHDRSRNNTTHNHNHAHNTEECSRENLKRNNDPPNPECGVKVVQVSPLCTLLASPYGGPRLVPI